MANAQNINLSRERSQWVRLRTLVVLRWIAIVGQIAAVLIADRVLDLVFNTELCFLVIAAAVIANLLAMFLFPENKRLGEFAVTSMLLFDVAQLSLLLFLTGGLHNPFAVMVLAPVGVLLGAWLHRRMSDRAFFAFAYGMLFVVALKLLYDGVTGLA